MSKTYTIIVGNDWEGLYEDGRLIVQGHHISAQDVLDALNLHWENAEVDYEWLEAEGYLPENIEDVKFEGEEE